VVVGIAECRLIGEEKAISGGQRGALSFRFSFLWVLSRSV